MAQVDEITEFLKRMNLQKFAPQIKEAGADNLGDLRDLDDEETKELAVEAGMKMIHQKKFIKACKILRDKPSQKDTQELDLLLQECGCMKYKDKLIENGLMAASDLKAMEDNDIKILLTDAGLGVLHKKKFLKLIKEYKNETFIPQQTNPSSMNESQIAEQKQPQQQHQQQQPIQPQQQQQQPQQAGMGGMGGMGGFGMLGGMFGGMNNMMDNMMGGKGQFAAHMQASAKHDLEKQKLELEKEKIALEREKMNPSKQQQQPTIVYPVQTQQQQYHGNHHHHYQQPSTSVTEVASNEQCPKCLGNGFVHESTMEHKTKKNKKCFFCQDCNGCKGQGFVKGTQKVITSTDAFGRSTMTSISSVTSCPKCRGHGWIHSSSMKHKTGNPNKRCFFCENCGSCKGTGRIST